MDRNPEALWATGFGVHRERPLVAGPPGCGAHMAFPSWEAGQLPMEPAGFPQANWPKRIGDIPTLGRGITLAMPCVGLDAFSAAMVEMRWPGQYMVKYAFDTDRDIAIPLMRLHGPPLPGPFLK